MFWLHSALCLLLLKLRKNISINHSFANVTHKTCKTWGIMINFGDAQMNKFRTYTKLGVLELRVNPKLFNPTFFTLYACLKPPCQHLSPCTLLFKQRKRVLIRILFCLNSCLIFGSAVLLKINVLCILIFYSIKCIYRTIDRFWVIVRNIHFGGP